MASAPLTATFREYALAFKRPAGTSRGYLHVQNTFFLCLRRLDQPDCFGLGECGPLAGLSIDDQPDFAQQVAQCCAAINQGEAPETLVADLQASGLPTLAFGLETAWLDLQGGGRRILFETPFSRGQEALPIHGLIWMADPQGVLDQIEREIALGHRCIKMKIGALDFAQECEILAAVRAKYPAAEIEIRLDANGAFSPESALEKLVTLAAYDIFAIEQPIKPRQWPAMAALCAESPLSIALDEELIGLKTEDEQAQMLQTIRPQYLVLKPTLVGGLRAAEKWITLAERLGIGWWINSALESNIGLNAIAQWTSSLDMAKTTSIQGLGTGQLYANNIPGPIRLVGTGLHYDPAGAWDLSKIVR